MQPTRRQRIPAFFSKRWAEYKRDNVFNDCAARRNKRTYGMKMPYPVIVV